MTGGVGTDMRSVGQEIEMSADENKSSRPVDRIGGKGQSGRVGGRKPGGAAGE